MTSSGFTPVLALGLALTSGLAMSCGTSNNEPPSIQTLDRPTDIAFACYGRMRITGGDGAQPGDPVEFQPHPLGSCAQRTGASLTPDPADDPDNAPVGQETLGSIPLGPGMTWFAFALQPVAGTVAVIRAEVQPDGKGYQPLGEVIVLDGDELAPGQNSLSVGSHPVAITTAPTGCHVLTANAGSCDLSVIDVDRVVERPEGQALVRRQALTTASGASLLARPAAIVADASLREIGVACPAEPDGLLYIAYPDCHAVAVIDAATGAAVASIRFGTDGTPTIGDGELDCPAQCGTSEPTTDGARPVTLDIMHDPLAADGAGLRRLAIGLEEHPVITVVDLDTTTWRPVGFEQIELEGEIGVLDIALSKRLRMTGAVGFNDDQPPELTIPAEFAYAVATDGTVRVAETGAQNTECDTQVDPRYLRSIIDPATFVCMAVGVPGTPPRRALARGPGIELPGDDIATQVTITKASNQPPTETGLPEPARTAGHFAFVAGSAGTVFTVNIDDDLYPDVYIPTMPWVGNLALVIPHQLRDAVQARAGVVQAMNGQWQPSGDPLCDDNGPSDGTAGPPRIVGPPEASLHTASIARDKGFMMPNVRQLHCMRGEGDTFTEAAVSELGWVAPPESRAQLFPDLRAMPFAEQWNFTWEGALSLDTPSVSIDGPAVRAARIEVGGGAMTIADAGRPFCAAGVEPHDHVVLRGCDPSRGAGQCGLGEVCYVHADTTVGTGACLPLDRADELGALCRDYLISLRRYAVQESHAGQLVLSERRRVLRTTPIEGCTSVQQCDELAEYETSMPLAVHPKDDVDENGLPPNRSTRTWACEPDPTRAPDVNRCVMTCTESSQCDAGTMCSGGYCIEGPLPSPQCVAGLQRYEVRGTDAFIAVGSGNGYLHPIIEEAGTDRCVRDPAAHPLMIGRIPLDVPACTGSDVTDVTPNPCRLTISHANTLPNYIDPENCERPTTAEDQLVIRTGDVEAIRFSNPALTFHLVDPTYPGDARCLHDRAGGRTGIPAVYPGYSVAFRTVAGFLAQGAGSATVLAANLVRSPDGAIWVVDQGDIVPVTTTDTVNIRGQVLRFDPDAIGTSATVR